MLCTHINSLYVNASIHKTEIIDCLHDQYCVKLREKKNTKKSKRFPAYILHTLHFYKDIFRIYCILYMYIKKIHRHTLPPHYPQIIICILPKSYVENP